MACFLLRMSLQGWQEEAQPRVACVYDDVGTSLLRVTLANHAACLDTVIAEHARGEPHLIFLFPSGSILFFRIRI